MTRFLVVYKPTLQLRYFGATAFIAHSVFTANEMHSAHDPSTHYLHPAQSKPSKFQVTVYRIFCSAL